MCQREGEPGMEEAVLKYYLTRPKPPPSHERDGPLGTIRLTEVELLNGKKKDSDLKTQFCAWQINKMRERRWVLMCDSAADKTRWIDALRSCMSTPDASNVGTPSTPGTTSSDTPRSMPDTP